MPSSSIPGVVGEYKTPVPHYSVYNYRSERHIPNARQADQYGYFPPCDTDDEFEMEDRFDARLKQKQQPNRHQFLEAVRDYLVSPVTRTNQVLTHLRYNIPKFSIPVQGDRTYYRGQKINAKTLVAMRNQKMKEPSNEAFTHGLVHGFRTQDNPSPEHKGLPFVYRGEEYTHHGVTSISSIYWQGKKAARMGRPPEILAAQGDIPLLLELETTQEKPFRAIAPKYNFYPLKYLKKPYPSSEHELLLDADHNTYRLSRVVFDEQHQMWVAKIWASAEPDSTKESKNESQNAPQSAPKAQASPEKSKARAKSGQAKPTENPSQQNPSNEDPPKEYPKNKPSTSSAKPNPFTQSRPNKLQPTSIKIDPKITSDTEKLACWKQVYEALEQHPDYRLTFDSRGKVWLDTEPPRFNMLKTFDPDHNALAQLAAQDDRHISRYSRPPFVVVTDRLHTVQEPHLLILPTPIRRGNYQDLRQFLETAPDRQKVALWNTMAALINGSKNLPDTATLFKTNGGRWQSIPYFSVHYMPYAQH